MSYNCMLQYVYGLIVDQEALQKNSFFSGFFFNM